LDLLLKRLYGPRSERYDPHQPWLFADPAVPADKPAALPAAAETDKPKRRARPHGRRRLPPHLPREGRHHVLAGAGRLLAGFGEPRIAIGADRSEQLDYRPAALRVIEHWVHKYVCPRCRPQRCRPGQAAEQESIAMSSQPPEPAPTPPAAESAAPASEP